MLLGMLASTGPHYTWPPYNTSPHPCIQPITSSLAFGSSATALSSVLSVLLSATSSFCILSANAWEPWGPVGRGEEAGESSYVSCRPQALTIGSESKGAYTCSLQTKYAFLLTHFNYCLNMFRCCCDEKACPLKVIQIMTYEHLPSSSTK